MKNELTNKELELLKTAKPNMGAKEFTSNAEKRTADKKTDTKELKKTKENGKKI